MLARGGDFRLKYQQFRASRPMESDSKSSEDLQKRVSFRGFRFRVIPECRGVGAARIAP